MKIPDNVLRILMAAETEGNALHMTQQLSRPDYEATAKVLLAVGGKWNRSAKAHLFDGDAGDALEQIISTGEYRNTKVELQQFYTPPELAAELAERACMGRPSRGRVLEPSAGRGALARAADRWFKEVRCFDIDPANVAALQAERFEAKCVDFLRVLPRPAYDVVIMNPPFTGGQDVDHVTHALGFLKPGGRLVAIVSAGVTFRTDRRTSDFKRLVLDEHDGEINALPEGAFKQSGTMVRTALVSLTKGGL